MDESIRLNKAIAQTGFCSRREADKFIEKGEVLVNGQKAVMGQQVSPNDSISVKGKQLGSRKPPVYIAFNKPVGVTCTTDSRIKNNIIDYINYGERIFNIGRLDKDSEGLILLTNDGAIVNKILRAENGHEKEYVVTVDKNISDEFIYGMGKGVPILDVTTLPCKVRKINGKSFSIVLKQGLNRQIRRMCEYFGYEVIALKRTRIMNVSLGNLQTGKWRYITKKELDDIEKLLAK
ncbi:MAG: 23S rRNA pseudouridine(2604) synthase RluF [Clostridia bacterium]|nr:23S rRNA pseudouridine(2604) synthase RluF [Clostridia bacterium]